MGSLQSASDPVSLLRLRDGRQLAYWDSGPAQARPVLFLHGLPSSRLLHPNAEATIGMGARLVTCDRPGFGLSDDKPGRSLLDFSDDLVELADHLGIERFVVAAPSGVSPSSPPAPCPWSRR